MTTRKREDKPRAKRPGSRKSRPSVGAPPERTLDRTPRTPRTRRASTSTVGLWLAVVLASGCVGAALWFLIYPTGRGPSAGNVVEFAVEGGESSRELADRLVAAGLVASPRLFAFYVSLTGGAGGIVKGVHLLTDDASPRELLGRLERLPSAGHAKVTFPEGFTRFDMAKRLQDKHVCSLRSFLDATTSADLLKELRIDGDSAEGFLFPSTYDLAPDSDARDVVRRMKTEFDRRYATVEQRYESGLLDLSREPLKFGTRDVVTLASMVEKEAAVDDERPIIASVFLNRLRDPDFKPKLLQCDPTAGYGCLINPELASCVGFSGKITPAMNNDAANRYSTYKHEGLPPGPIANPGAKSLAAAMNAATTRYFYFVAKGEGRHTFSETYGSHSAAIHDNARETTKR